MQCRLNSAVTRLSRICFSSRFFSTASNNFVPPVRTENLKTIMPISPPPQDCTYFADRTRMKNGGFKTTPISSRVACGKRQGLWELKAGLEELKKMKESEITTDLIKTKVMTPLATAFEHFHLSYSMYARIHCAMNSDLYIDFSSKKMSGSDQAGGIDFMLGLVDKLIKLLSKKETYWNIIDSPLGIDRSEYKRLQKGMASLEEAMQDLCQIHRMVDRMYLQRFMIKVGEAKSTAMVKNYFFASNSIMTVSEEKNTDKISAADRKMTKMIDISTTTASSIRLHS